MGNTFEIWSWQRLALGQYEYVQVWTGESEAEAFAEMHRLKHSEDHPCLKLEWR